MSEAPGLSLGVDVGGTFTDFFEFGPGGVRVGKRLSTPDPADAVIEGLGQARPGRIVHGSTVATNAVLERRGPRTVLVTTEGFRDILEIRRQERPALYDLEPYRPPHVVQRGDVVAVHERLDHEGRVLIELTGDEVRRVVAEVGRLGAESVAVALLFAYVEPVHERRLAEALREAGFDVSASHEVSPEHREYERASTTAINAFLRPTVRGYLDRLAESAPGLRVMHSAAGITAVEEASARPVSMVLSGPAGGVLGALAVARAAGFDDIISFDMGGTSTDVALSTGEVRLRSGAEIDGLALRAPVVDLVTVGAGGGSIARIDEGGAMRAGPASAGANPGPACYGRGGAEPTVSDANAQLGRLRPDRFLGGEMRLDLAAAERALAALGESMEAAKAVIEVVNANMARALRAVSLERGFDPADFTLVAFGGAGPLHAAELAAEIGIVRVLVPRYPGVLSALGMVTASEVVEESRGLVEVLGGGDDSSLSGAVVALRGAVGERFAMAHGTDAPATVSWAADLRYAGQAHELRVPVEAPEAGAMTEAFHRAHEQRYGYATRDTLVELVTLRARASSPPPPFPLERSEESAQEAPLAVSIELWAAGMPAMGPGSLYEREALLPGATFTGPAIVTQPDATTVVPPGWAVRVDGYGNMVLEAQG